MTTQRITIHNGCVLIPFELWGLTFAKVRGSTFTNRMNRGRMWTMAALRPTANDSSRKRRPFAILFSIRAPWIRRMKLKDGGIWDWAEGGKCQT